MTDGSAAKDNTSLDTDFPLQSSKSHICDSHRLDCYRPKKQDGELLPVIVKCAMAADFYLAAKNLTGYFACG